MTTDGLRRDLESALESTEDAESRYHIRQALQRLKVIEQAVLERRGRAEEEQDREGTEEPTEPR